MGKEAWQASKGVLESDFTDLVSSTRIIGAVMHKAAQMVVDVFGEHRYSSDNPELFRV